MLSFKYWSGPRLGQHAPYHERIAIGLVWSVLHGASFLVGKAMREYASTQAIPPLLSGRSSISQLFLKVVITNYSKSAWVHWHEPLAVFFLVCLIAYFNEGKSRLECRCQKFSMMLGFETRFLCFRIKFLIIIPIFSPVPEESILYYFSSKHQYSPFIVFVLICGNVQHDGPMVFIHNLRRLIMILHCGYSSPIRVLVNFKHHGSFLFSPDNASSYFMVSFMAVMEGSNSLELI